MKLKDRDEFLQGWQQPDLLLQHLTSAASYGAGDLAVLWARLGALSVAALARRYAFGALIRLRCFRARCALSAWTQLPLVLPAGALWLGAASSKGTHVSGATVATSPL